jgi:hypothetical protein
MGKNFKDYCRGEPMCSPDNNVNPNTLFNLLMGMMFYKAPDAPPHSDG